MRLEPFRIEHYFDRYEFTTPFMLSGSDCESLSVRELAEMGGATERLLDCWLGYTETPGGPDLRRAIASLYRSIDADDVLVHCGAGEAIFTFMNAALERGDHVVVHYPCYQSLFEVAAAIGCEVTRWTVREEDGWELDLERHLRPDTKAVVVNCPHNPTGYLMSKEKLLALDALSRRHGFLVFSDEVYRLLEHDEADRLPAFCDVNETAVSLGVMSKSFGLAGLRIGWIATRNRELRARIASIKHYTTLCSSAPSEVLAAVALDAREAILRRNRAIVLANLALLDAFLARHAERLSWRRPRAGAIGFPTLRSGEDLDRFCRDAIAGVGVLLLPGTVYDAGSRAFRIGFGRRNFAEGLERLDGFLSARA
jgi:aspartate/methionine/tyrosine aminotransferase